jgi:hypothetical protein
MRITSRLSACNFILNIDIHLCYGLANRRWRFGNLLFSRVEWRARLLSGGKPHGFSVGLSDASGYVLNVIFTARLVGELFSFRIHGGRGFLFFVSF